MTDACRDPYRPPLLSFGGLPRSGAPSPIGRASHDASSDRPLERKRSRYHPYVPTPGRPSRPVCIRCVVEGLPDCSRTSQCTNCRTSTAVCIYRPCPRGLDCPSTACVDLHPDQWRKGTRPRWHVEGVTISSALRTTSEEAIDGPASYLRESWVGFKYLLGVQRTLY